MSNTSSQATGCGCGGCGCECCEGITALTPRPTENRAGLSALHLRIGSHGSFLQSMKAQLSSLSLDGGATRALAGLRVRDGGDPAIALLDAWATVGDVLTFYQERIANEGYLRTATQMRSLFELSRLVGYVPRPGVAAGTYLAYTIDANHRQDVLIAQGSRAQTIPAQDELPQTFETSADLRARAAWNRMGLRTSEPQQWPIPPRAEARQRVFLAGTQTRLKPDDPLLISGCAKEEAPQAFAVVSVTPDTTRDLTEVEIRPWGSPTERTDVRASVAESFAELIAQAPKGKAADDIKDRLSVLETLQNNSADLTAEISALRSQVETFQATLAHATRLRGWMDRVVRALLPSSAGSPTLPRSIASVPIDTLVTQITQLTVPPSKPLDNELQLPRSLTTSFVKGSDVALRTLTVGAPVLKDSLAPALAGFQNRDLQQEMRVWAPRLRVGVFGRAFPRQMASQTSNNAAGTEGAVLTSTRTADLGEWPMFLPAGTDLAPTEQKNVLQTDASYDGIAQGSWVLIDTSAVRTHDAKSKARYPLVMPAQAGTLVTRVSLVQPKVSRAAYGGSGDTNLLTLDAPWLAFETDDTSITPDAPEEREINFDVVRRTVVYAASEALALAQRPIEDDLLMSGPADPPDPPDSSHPSDRTTTSEQWIELDGLYTDLEAGRFVIVSGERTDVPDTQGLMASEPVMITSVIHDVRAASHDEKRESGLAAGRAIPLSQAPSGTPGLAGDKVHTFITIDKPLAYSYRRDSVGIFGNVVKATHGDTRNETLGSGDGAAVLQSFELKQAPLTWLPAATARGAQSTLNVYVNDVLWRPVDSFLGLGPNDRVYVMVTDDLGKTTVRFGDGREGARLPTGVGNVRAVYRSGVGRPGNVRPGQISQLMSRPLGVNGVTNPLRSSGGVDRDSLAQVRRNAPLAVKALDRLVSTPDYADFACTFAGIAKADALEIGNGESSLVHVTVADADDAPIDAGADLLVRLRTAMRDLGDPFLPLTVVPRELRLLVVSARIAIDRDQLWEAVVVQVRAALLEAFGFERMELAQGIASSRVVSVIQAVRGVSWVDLDAFGAVDTLETLETGEQRLRMPDELSDAVAVVAKAGSVSAVQSRRARRASGSPFILPAQLILLSPDVPETLVLNQAR